MASRALGKALQVSDVTTVPQPSVAATSTYHLALLGLMASGKSTVGRAVANRLGWTFIDVDDVIEASTGTSVAELWDSGDEQAFRALEREVVLEALSTPGPNVLAAPGGVVVDEVAAHAVDQPGVLAVYLRADPRLLAQRIEADVDHPRPLVDDDPLAVMEELFAERDAAYQALADHTVDITDMTADQVVHAVLHLAIRHAAAQR